MTGGPAVSTVGLVAALVYLVFAVWVVFSERTGPGGGGWISLSGMASYLVTLPISAPFEMMGMRPDYRKNIDMALTIAVCTLLVYLVAAGAAWLVRTMLFSGRDA